MTEKFQRKSVQRKKIIKSCVKRFHSCCAAERFTQKRVEVFHIWQLKAEKVYLTLWQRYDIEKMCWLNAKYLNRARSGNFLESFERA